MIIGKKIKCHILMIKQILPKTVLKYVYRIQLISYKYKVRYSFTIITKKGNEFS